MTQPQSIDIRARLNTLLPPEELERLARESGLIRRRRKLDPVAMLESTKIPGASNTGGVDCVDGREPSTR